ncbi:hypothetical protein ACIQ1D_18715 [Lysinibacillus xylanilyticus]|uniref:hypothetical protein n=1 Tax=Lysinibacillus xylanilyticus TaxID=582475 RepID=UPI003824DB87
MTNIVVIWKNHTIKKVELDNEQLSKLFSGVYVCTLDEKLPEIYSLEDGRYFIEGVNQYFTIKTKEVKQLNSKWREIIFPLGKSNVIHNYLDELHEREGQEKLGEILAEITVFENDISTPLEFVDGVAKMKNYYNKTLEIKKCEGFEIHDLMIDGKDPHVEIHYFEGQYACHDGATGYGWYDTIKKAVKSYMNQTYRYPSDEEYYEPSCTNCGDGGCFHCEPYRFL